MVALAPLQVSATTVKPGSRSRVIEATLSQDGRMVALAVSQWVAAFPIEWVPEMRPVASRVHGSPHGVGFCETVLSDDAGMFGRVLQTLVEAPPELGDPGFGGRDKPSNL